MPVLLLCLAPLASAKKKPFLPEIFATAQTVFVESKDGDITNLNLSRDQRVAILDTQDALKDWGRYSLSRSRHDADLILVVFRGRLDPRPLNGASPNGTATATLPGTRNTQPGHTPIQDPSQADNSSASDPSNPFPQQKDELRAYTLKPDGKFGQLLWHAELDNGLHPPTLQLLRQLRADVDNSYPPPRQP